MEIEIGKIIQNYQIVSKLAEGGMGVIYLARHLKLEREAVLKVLHSNFFYNNDVRQRFYTEANTLSKLSHPNIVSIYDFLEIDNQFYLILEYAEGLTMDRYIQEKRGENNEAAAINIFSQILDGFSYAHNHNVIHRDIKPSNIIIQNDSSVKILDFGIAKILDRNDNNTKTGSSLGTITYMSPEQILGKKIDSRTDIYSVGITLYEFLTGMSAYGSDDISQYEIQTKILNENLLFFNADISSKFVSIISKATAKNPLDRYNDCAEFKADLLSNSVNYQSINRIQRESIKTQYIPQNFSERKPASSINKLIPIFAVIAFLVLCLSLYFSFFFNNNKITYDGSGKIIVNSTDKSSSTNSTINNEELLIKKTVNNLIDAWQQKKIDSFFSYLTDDYSYQSSSGVSRNYLERKNKAYEIFASNSFITISTSNMSVSVNGDNAEVKYDQVYHSTTINESTVKKLFLRKLNNQWKVYKELSGFY
ncbi:MAG: serine/threonine protein kinase [Ignavibacteria bacterium]|nr:serine/threonine protein kinase [Ignavibacteria bacterium]